MNESARPIDPIREAIQIFLNLKARIIDRLGDNKLSETIGSKLRTRSREIPEMILDLGLVPTLSFCLAKAGINNVRRVIHAMEREGDKSINIDDTVKYAYALYTYAILKYLTLITGDQVEELLEKDKVITFLKKLIETNAQVPLYNMLQPYLIQFKRVCEATYRPEEELR
jgi:CRISPR type III-B/RAMP module-associated protein Cmr5